MGADARPGRSTLIRLMTAPDPELTAAAPTLLLALLLAALATLALVALHREQLRRVLLGVVDPRPLALLRIGFGSCLLLGALEVAPLNLYLFSDEGLLPSAAVPQVYAKALLADDGALAYVSGGRWSLLHFIDDPAFVRAYFAAFLAAGCLFVLGWRTRLCAVITWLLYLGMLRRGDAHWGGEQVYCGFLFLLLLARCGEAFSVDNWLRCRRLRRRGLLSEPGGPGDGAGAPPGPGHVQGLAAIYRRVPAWPQALIVLQLAICYTANGWAKWGPVWSSGDALMYALELDKWTRADWHPLVVALGATPLRLAAWAVLWWERLFPLILVGLWLPAVRRTGVQISGSQRRASQACWLVIAGALVIAALSGDLVAKPGDPSASARALVLGAIAAAIVAFVGIGERRAPAWLRWPFAPRVWLGFGVLFHAMNLALFNVGAFALATMSVYLVCGMGPVRALQRLSRGLARIGVPVPKHMSRETAIAAEDVALPTLRRDGAAVPGWALAGAGGLLLVGAGLGIGGGPVWWHAAWLSSALALIVIGRRSAERAPALTDGPPWAYGPAGRLAAGGVFSYHLLALLIWQLPPWPALPQRDAARALVAPWMDLTGTRQAWAMFAPNVGREDISLRTRVVDGAGVEHDLRTEPQHRRRGLALAHDRWLKIDDVIGHGRPELAPWHARWVCRTWEAEHGAPATAVILERVTAPNSPGTPAPTDFWQAAQVKPITRVECASEPYARLDDEVRARHGLPPAGAVQPAQPKGPQPDPLAPLGLLLGLGLAGGLALWARADRRRHVAAVAARR